MAVIFGWTHGIDQIITRRNELIAEPEEGETIFSEEQMWTGLVLICSMTVLVLTGILFKFMSSFFETFLRIHWVFFVTVLVFCFMHGNIFPFYIGGGFLVLDLILRIIFMLWNLETLNADIERIENTKITKLSWDKKKFRYWPGQFVFLNIPSITPIQNHAFSLASSPYEKRVTIYVKALGSFTEDLHKKALKQK